MAVPYVLMYDAIGANVSSLPHGQHAGYVTGWGSVPWSAAQWAADPDAVRIDQAPVNTPANELCDVLDVESGAATLADCAPWAKAAAHNWLSATRPGQRTPVIYCSDSEKSNVVNALVAGGVPGGVGLWLAKWETNQNTSMLDAEARVAGASGPFPVVAVQFANHATYDSSIVSVPWLRNRSGLPAPTPTSFQVTSGAPGWWKVGTMVTLRGTGSDGRPYSTSTNNGITWTPPKEG